MVHGKSGLRLEAFKFGVYLSLPVIASFTFNEPKVQEFCADYFQFLKYPANPNTNLREQFEDLAKKKQIENEQRKKHTEELKKLHENNARKRQLREAAIAEEDTKHSGWLRWLRFRRRQNSTR